MTVVPAVPWLKNLAGHRVVVIGDPVLDVYLNGATERVSREAPVLIVREESRDLRLGGAANTAANLASLGARVTLVGLVGEDAEAGLLTQLVHGADIRSTLLPRSGGRTISKTRVMAGGLHIRKQQMLRIDRDNPGAPAADCLARLEETALRAVAEADALVVSDYGDPSLTDVYVRVASHARAGDRLVVVDSRHALLRFEGVTAVTPNQPEVEALLGRPLQDPEDTLKAARWLVERMHIQAAVVTRGRQGMAVADDAGTSALIPAVGGEAVDVTGAGDTVTAAFALAVLAGASTLDAARLANQAAAITVQQVGTAVCTPEQLASIPYES